MDYLEKWNLPAEFKHLEGRAEYCEWGVYRVTTHRLTVLSRPPAGYHCVSCNDFAAQSEPNLPDGRFQCWSCRQTHRHAS